MPTDQRERLARIRRFDQLVAYLRDELGWPIDSDDFEDLTFPYTSEELGIDLKTRPRSRISSACARSYRASLGGSSSSSSSRSVCPWWRCAASSAR